VPILILGVMPALASAKQQVSSVVPRTGPTSIRWNAHLKLNLD
jgi:hypothetical protein